MKLLVFASLIATTSSVGVVSLVGSAASAAAGLLTGGTVAGTAPAVSAVAEFAAGAAAGHAVAAGTGATAGGAVAISPAALGTGALALKVLSLKKSEALVAVAGLGSILVGTDANASAVTWDCWKPILHERSAAPSRGRLLADLLNDPVISDSHIGRHAVFVRNRWNESWRIDPVVLPWGQVAAHASQVVPLASKFSDVIGTLD
eukprot:TRINITY_DN6580_c0_g3_i1.p1 TRINITY_DN6580_c0_g3~~TRINITY_DN6580_c0_g3_i1.p1  ORF type:complete len:204 (-),score=34.55 TRINITY_DN6580_c0_g3_i1:297-908(-)